MDGAAMPAAIRPTMGSLSSSAAYPQQPPQPATPRQSLAARSAGHPKEAQHRRACTVPRVSLPRSLDMPMSGKVRLEALTLVEQLLSGLKVDKVGAGASTFTHTAWRASC